MRDACGGAVRASRAGGVHRRDDDRRAIALLARREVFALGPELAVAGGDGPRLDTGAGREEGDPEKGKGDQAVAAGHVMSFQKSGVSRQS